MKAILLTMVGLLSAQTALADTADLPPDVKIFLDRVERCERAARQESYESERRDQIHQTYENLGCRNLMHDEALLRARYADNDDAMHALDTTAKAH